MIVLGAYQCFEDRYLTKENNELLLSVCYSLILLLYSDILICIIHKHIVIHTSS